MNMTDFDRLLSETNSALLLGNGFSMNFDSGFSNIHSRLYETHKLLYKTTSYYSEAPNSNLNTKRKKGYENVIQKMKYWRENEFYEIFNQGVNFAQSIACFDGMEEWLILKKCNYATAGGYGVYHDCMEIYQTAKNKGVAAVNIEYWPTLIYMYYVLSNESPDNYILPANNSFTDLICAGEYKQINLYGKSVPVLDTYNNGFNTYYKMLYSLAIFNQGKAIGQVRLDKIEQLNKFAIGHLLEEFKFILTLNYDHIIEENWNNIEVVHLHGAYELNDDMVFYQKMLHDYSGVDVNFSSILIGDFLCNKTHQAITSQKMNKGGSRAFESANELINNAISNHKISNIIIFGMNICNDQDLLRYIMLAYEKECVEKPIITYCYFTIDEKLEFEKQFEKAKSFSQEVNLYCEKIVVHTVATQDILQKYFF